MVAIFKDFEDTNFSYDEVVDWLNYHGSNVEFYTGTRFLSEEGSDWSVHLNSKEQLFNIQLDEIKSVWFRGFLRHRNYARGVISEMSTSNDNISELRYRLSTEIRKVSRSIFSFFKNKYQLPKIESIAVDKFSTLITAKEHGLKIPESLITNSRLELLKFLAKHKEIITKSLYETVYFEEEKEVFFYKTELISSSDKIKEAPNCFFPSLFQEYIDKEIEIRVFYIEKKLYSMAIFSQNDPQTKVDFRNYNDSRPNRYVPYKVPMELEEKIHSLMSAMNLSTGSIDFIKSLTNEYYFLEVNPTGQFGFVSKSCNYYLEEIIAKELISNGE